MEARFTLFGIPIQVGAFFLLMAVLVGRYQATSPVLMASWIVIAFVGVLMHELGHALTAKAFGQEPAISLHGLGGVTTWLPRGTVGPGKRAVITIMGPLVGIAVGIPALVLFTILPEGGMARQLTSFVWYVNLVWGLFNLLPMIPLDGGRIMASLLEMAVGPGGQRAAHFVSIGVAVLVGIGFALLGQFIVLVFCGFFVYLNVQGLRAAAGRSAPTVAPPVGG